MSGYAHLTAGERDRIAGLKADGLSLRAIGRALGRSASTISRELRRNALDSGAYRPHIADGAYMLRRQRAAVLETDAKLAAYVMDRLSEGWTPEQIAGRLRAGSKPACGRSARRRSTAGSIAPARKQGGSGAFWPAGAPVEGSATAGRRATRLPRKSTFLSDLATLTPARRWGTGKLTL
jgi:transcriptional regulator with XRE-family HTH domain